MSAQTFPYRHLERQLRGGLVDQYGNALTSSKEEPRPNNLRGMQEQILRVLKAKYDAAQSSINNERHWENADRLDPHAAASWKVRQLLRIRSRYEVIENNPYLKGCLLTLANDFVGSGPKLSIQDDFIKPAKAKAVSSLFMKWMAARRIRQKLWRAKLAKTTDGETFLFAFTNKESMQSRRVTTPISLDFFMVEADQISNSDYQERKPNGTTEMDGVQWDKYGNPLKYYLLDEHPGSSVWGVRGNEGKWIKADQVIHWFRQDRGWLRGIPELTPSLPLCALLRRYTIAVVRAAEIGADFSAVLETEAPPALTNFAVDENGNPIDDPFDAFPIEMGMFTTLPWGMKLKQLEAKQPMQSYEMFVNALLTEIVRPLLMPFNLAAGTSKDSNMATAVVDTHIYKGNQGNERLDCEESVLTVMFSMWLYEASRIPGYLPIKIKELPEHSWRWDKIGLDHTDPVKVAQAHKIAHDKGFITDRDYQEQIMNRDVEDWQKEIEENLRFRKKIGNYGLTDGVIPPTPAPAGKSLPKKTKAQAQDEDDFDEAEEDTVIAGFRN